MKIGAILPVAAAAAAAVGAPSVASAEPLSIYGELGCAVYDVDGNFMRLNKAGVYETVKNPGSSSFFQTSLEISEAQAGYRLLGPQFPVIDSFGNEQIFPKTGKFSAVFSYTSEGRDFFDIKLGNLEGSWDNSWQRLEMIINPTLGISLKCNFPSD